MAERNQLEARAALLQQTIDRRVAMLMKRMTEPAPPFMEKVPEPDQVRKYMRDREDGSLFKMRESNGGPYRDEDVDAYVQWGEKKLQTYAPKLILQDHTNDQGELHPGLLHALGGALPGMDTQNEDVAN